jgi:hypothetical protein
MKEEGSPPKFEILAKKWTRLRILIYCCDVRRVK